ncbi:hypothetical protein LSH36_251g06027 [Paralvinella palmiformis]|uniref:Uncharacterized protein n=1 Tax=Paralvinella palmiformis TaxID=53620 RepID=A0AAD9JL81_9ANNE|nr:hypothetical protein LSH36_251g06027 [Paralvinella palmiformis]
MPLELREPVEASARNGTTRSWSCDRPSASGFGGSSRSSTRGVTIHRAVKRRGYHRSGTYQPSTSGSCFVESCNPPAAMLQVGLRLTTSTDCLSANRKKDSMLKCINL